MNGSNTAFYYYHIMCELIHLKEKGLINTIDAEDSTIISTMALIYDRVQEMEYNENGACEKLLSDTIAKITRETLKALFPAVANK